MASLDEGIPLRIILLWILAAIAVYMLAGPVSSTAPGTILMLALGGVVVIVSFMSTEAAIYILICSMLLSPEFGATEGGIAEERSITVRADDLLILLIGFSWFARTAIQKELGLFPHTPLNRPILLYIFACAFPTALGMMVGRIQGLSGIFYLLKYIEYFIIYFIVVNYMYSSKQAKSFVMVVLATCVLVCLYGILQIPGGGRVSAPFEGQAGEPNTFGGYLVLMWSVVLGLYLTTSNPRLKRWLLVISGLIVLPLMFTLSRASWAAAGGMYLVLIVLSERRALLIGMGVLLIALSPLIIPKQVALRAVGTFQAERGYAGTEKFGGVALDPSASARVTTNTRALEKWESSPIWGYGITGAGVFLDSQYFRTLVELGVIGLGAFLWLMWTTFRIGLHNYRNARSEFTRGISLGYLAGLGGLLVHALGSTTFIIIRIMEPFWLLTAVVLLLPTLEDVDQEVEQDIGQDSQRVSPMLGRTPGARALVERRVVRARDLIRSRLQGEKWK